MYLIFSRRPVVGTRPPCTRFCTINSGERFKINSRRGRGVGGRHWMPKMIACAVIENMPGLIY